MTVPDLDPINGVYNYLTPAPMWSPYTPAWWMNSYIERIPETSVGWLVAQGWQIVSTTTEDDVTYYTLSRQTMQNWVILQALMDSYTYAYNEGRAFNAIRYNDLLYNWDQAITATSGTLNTIGDISNRHITVYLGLIDSMLSDLETDFGDIKDELDGINTDVDTKLTAYANKLAELDGDFDTHQALTRTLLTGLGTAETARINEQFDNALSSARQGLVNRGLYSSTLFTTIEARIERERSEALSKWNDQLNREKLDNEHKLFAEQMGTSEAVLGGYARHVATLMQKINISDAKQRMVLALMQGRLEKINARMGIRDREEKLMLAQLDIRNNIAFALHAQIERRSDEYPDMSSVAKLVAGLGDAGGGWLQP